MIRISSFCCMALVAASVADPIAVDTMKLESLAYDGGRVKIIASSAQTGGRSSAVEVVEMPGYRTPWHRHDEADETFYVLEGVLTIRIGEKQYELPAGSFAFVPKGTPHGQANAGDVPVRVLIGFSPGGFEQFFVDRVELAKSLKPGDPEFGPRMLELSARYPQWITQLGRWDPAVRPGVPAQPR